MKRTTLVICLAAIMLLALAVPAFADGTSGTVYGKAVLAPYAITISGGGTDPSSPLTYQGNLGQLALEQDGAQVNVTNSGTQDTHIKLDVNQLPTDGTSTWNLSGELSYGSLDTAIWAFGDSGSRRVVFVVPTSDPDYEHSEFANTLASGDSWTLDSFFVFPTSTSSMADHYMSATISAVPAVN
jgi:hypothetical protein